MKDLFDCHLLSVHLNQEGSEEDTDGEDDDQDHGNSCDEGTEGNLSPGGTLLGADLNIISGRGDVLELVISLIRWRHVCPGKCALRQG